MKLLPTPWGQILGFLGFFWSHSIVPPSLTIQCYKNLESPFIYKITQLTWHSNHTLEMKVHNALKHISFHPSFLVKMTFRLEQVIVNM